MGGGSVWFYECNVYDGSALHRKLESSGRAAGLVKEAAQEIAKITKQRNLRSPLKVELLNSRLHLFSERKRILNETAVPNGTV